MNIEISTIVQTTCPNSRRASPSQVDSFLQFLADGVVIHQLKINYPRVKQHKLNAQHFRLAGILTPCPAAEGATHHRAEAGIDEARSHSVDADVFRRTLLGEEVADAN